MCMLAVKGHPQQESLIDSRRIRREANTRANKCTLVQSQLHVLAPFCQQLCSKRWLPLGSPTINELSNWNITKMSMFNCMLFFFLTSRSHSLHIWPNESSVFGELTSLPTNPEKVYWLLFPHILHKSPRIQDTDIAAWCNTAACTSTAKGYTASGAGSNTAGKSFLLEGLF